MPQSRGTYQRLPYPVLVCLLLGFPRIVSSQATSWKAIRDEKSQAELFRPCDAIRVDPPSSFPIPTRPLNSANVTVVIEPTMGQHRTDQDVVLAYAEGYSLAYYMMFLGTLTDTGYRGDVVMAIAEDYYLKPNVKEYLKQYTVGDTNKPSLVVYQAPLICENENLENGHKRKLTPSGDTDIFQFCQIPGLYGWKEESGNVIAQAPDPREARVVATIRYEWYWVWTQKYQPNVWILLIDARDSYFQANPFLGLPRSTNTSQADGVLYFYGENPDATRLGKSRKNIKWLSVGYGMATFNALANKPTICSGSTMGEQVALESYLRAMINEHEEADVKMTGSDQGFHNYLYYSNKLSAVPSIRRIVLWEQGRGAVNNLGALRIKPLSEWGMYNEETHEIFQWDGESLSPVVHQWDRDKHLHSWMHGKKHKDWVQTWQDQQAAPQ